MATPLITRREDDQAQASQLKLGGSASAEMKQGLRTGHSTAGGLRHRKNLRGEATIQLRSRKEKWDVGDSPGTMWMKDIDEPEGANQCGKLNRHHCMTVSNEDAHSNKTE